MIWKYEAVRNEFKKCAREHLNNPEIEHRLYREGLGADAFSPELREVVYPIYCAAKTCGFSSWEYEPGEHETGVHEPGEYEQGEHEPGEHEPGEHETGEHESGEYESGEHETGEHEPGLRPVSGDLLCPVNGCAFPEDGESLFRVAERK